MAAKKKGYLNYGFEPIINLILAIIPVTSWILGGITRIMRAYNPGKTNVVNFVVGILQLVFPVCTLILWILDIITVATEGDLTYFA